MGVGLQLVRSYSGFQNNESKMVALEILKDPKDYVMAYERYAASVVSIIGFNRRISSKEDPIITEVIAVMQKAAELNVPGKTFPMLLETFPCKFVVSVLLCAILTNENSPCEISHMDGPVEAWLGWWKGPRTIFLLRTRRRSSPEEWRRELLCKEDLRRGPQIWVVQPGNRFIERQSFRRGKRHLEFDLVYVHARMLCLSGSSSQGLGRARSCGWSLSKPWS